MPSLKCRVALGTAYATGMRVSEVAAVEVRNIDSGWMVIWIEHEDSDEVARLFRFELAHYSGLNAPTVPGYSRPSQALADAWI